nr:hypothetical protein [uncultured Ruminococcus sp.]
MKMTNNIKRTMTITIAAAMITATAMLSGCGCDDSNAINKTATTVQTTSVEEETTAPETAPTLSETDKAITDAGLKVGADGKITDKNGKEVKVDKDGKVEVKNEKGETVKVDSSEVKKANQNKVKVDSYPTNSSSQKKDTSTSGKNNNSSSKSNTSKSDSKKDTSSSSKAESSKPESSKSEPKPTQHTHSWKDITKATQVKVVDQEAYTFEEPIYDEQIRTICKVCGADITGFASEHNEQHALNGEPVSYKAERREIQTGTKTITVPEKSHYETKTKVVGRKCSGCGKVEYY